MVKHTIGARGVYLGTGLGRMGEGVAVGTLGASVSITCFWDLEVFGKWKYIW